MEEGGLFAAHKLGKPGAGRPPSIECLSTEELPGSESCRKVGNGLWTSSFGDAKAAVASGVAEKDDFVCICGYAGWAPKQLEGELERHSWYAGQQKRAKFPTSKAHISAVFHSFRLIFGRAIISRNGVEAWVLFSERARAERSRGSDVESPLSCPGGTSPRRTARLWSASSRTSSAAPTATFRWTTAWSAGGV